jgi:PAS domain S-box-containing protein
MDDITAAHEHGEQALRHLTVIAEQAREGIVVVELNGALRFVNPAWATMHGYEAGHELIGQQISIFHTEEQMKTDVIPFIEEAKRRGQLAGPVEHVRRDGTPFPTEMLMVVFKDEAGKAMGLICFATDLTEHERTKDELKRYRNHLAELVKQQTAQLEAADEQAQNRIAERERAEEYLEQQTGELKAANEQLQNQIAEREGAEQRLKQQIAELKAENEQLENQIGERKAVQNELQEDRDQLERHLRQQSDELTAANEQLQHEISQREQAEERLALLQTRLDNINSIIQKHL